MRTSRWTSSAAALEQDRPALANSLVDRLDDYFLLPDCLPRAIEFLLERHDP